MLPKKRFHFRNKPAKVEKKAEKSVKEEIKEMQVDPETDLVIRKLKNETLVVDPS